MSSLARNGVFDDVLEVTDQILAHGQKLGEVDGQLQGYHEGHAVGLRKGGEIGKELGFYEGFASVVVELAEKYPEIINTRVRQTASRLVESLRAFPLGVATDESINQRLQLIRAKFKVLSSLLGLSGNFVKNEPKDPVAAL